MSRRAVLLLAVFGCGACSGSPDVPSRPSLTVPAEVTVAGVMITPSTDLLTIQGSQTFTATATMSDLTVKTVAGTWTSDDPAVAAVDATGRVTAVAPGQTVLSVAYGGMKAMRTLRVVPDYQGNWAGNYAVLTCQDSGDFSRQAWCRTALKNGIIRMTMTLTQTRDTASGSWTHDAMAGTTQGSIEMDGTLSLSGTGTLDGTPVAIAGWRSRSTDNRSQSGRFTLGFTSSVWSGSAQASVEIRTCAREP